MVLGILTLALIFDSISTDPFEIAFVELSQVSFEANGFVGLIFKARVVSYFFWGFEQEHSEPVRDCRLILKNIL